MGQIDKEKLITMFKSIHALESQNVRTKKYDDPTMVKWIIHIIKKHADDDKKGSMK